jgi:hypothetical protein
MSMVIAMISIAISMFNMMRSASTQITYSWDLIPVWLPLDLCQVHECGVRLLYKDGIHRFDLIMPGYFRFNPLDRDGLEAMFQAKRARFQDMR